MAVCDRVSLGKPNNQIRCQLRLTFAARGCRVVHQTTLGFLVENTLFSWSFTGRIIIHDPLNGKISESLMAGWWFAT